MTASSWPSSIAAVLASEGGYSDNPLDPGGPTNLGITQKTLAAYRGISPSWKITAADVKSLTKAEAEAIYNRNYWSVIHGDDLPAGIDYCVFDYAVNSGPSRAVKALQAALSLTQDGIVGPITLAAADEANAARVISAICDSRLSFLKSLPTWSTFGNGWSTRVGTIRVKSLAMAASAQSFPAGPPIPKPIPSQPAVKSEGFWATLIKLILSLFARRT